MNQRTHGKIADLEAQTDRTPRQQRLLDTLTDFRDKEAALNEASNRFDAEHDDRGGAA